ncbi:NAD+--dinitrogen-reductase ADP-D-ribosyltransferase [Alteromonadaceae bacterium 2753L.S.0a.02]|nr:NAD+--dinitrogen-reductase ADP-D-ribosyltransferase [Alteromonadaceae bacterium 2753L.S.0a.02]
MMQNKRANASYPSLPNQAHSALNRCNLPAVILGSLTFQRQPKQLLIDGVLEMHAQLFDSLEEVSNAETRAVFFRDYMASCFLLDNKADAGLDEHARLNRGNADYLRLLRGWLFNPDGIEAAVLKRWVESRFGLLARNHQGLLRDFHGQCYAQYQADYMRGLYNTNALEAQLDLLFSFCQYELQRRFTRRDHWTLYRGVNHINDFENLTTQQDHHILLLNNLNSFSADADLAGMFGDVILEVRVPLSKVLYFPGLLPGLMQGEDEYLVLGGVYAVKPV